MKNVRTRDFFAWCLSFCFAGLAMTAAAQLQTPGPNPNSNAPVVIPPDTLVQPQPGVQPQPSADAWDRSWKIEKVSAEDEWTRHFRIGAMVGMNISANFNLKNTIPLSDKNATQGNYDNGYVRPSGNGDYTSDWGYNDSSQYNASQHRLFMHQSTSFAPDSGAASAEESGSALLGFDMAYGGNLWKWGKTRIGWELGFGLLPINITDSQPISGKVNGNILAFDTSGIDNIGVSPNPFPPAGYRGGPGGTWSIPSAPLEDETKPADPINETITGSHSLDVMLYTVRLGPSLYWDVNEYIGVSAGAGPAVGIVSGNYKYNEIVSVGGARNHGQIDATDIVYGGYVNATLMYHVEENGDFFVGVQYMPLGDATIGGGGREGRLKLGGQVYISAGINWPF